MVVAIILWLFCVAGFRVARQSWLRSVFFGSGVFVLVWLGIGFVAMWGEGWRP